MSPLGNSLGAAQINIDSVTMVLDEARGFPQDLRVVPAELETIGILCIAYYE